MAEFQEFIKNTSHSRPISSDSKTRIWCEMFPWQVPISPHPFIADGTDSWQRTSRFWLPLNNWGNFFFQTSQWDDKSNQARTLTRLSINPAPQNSLRSLPNNNNKRIPCVCLGICYLPLSLLTPALSKYRSHLTDNWLYDWLYKFTFWPSQNRSRCFVLWNTI